LASIVGKWGGIVNPSTPRPEGLYLLRVDPDDFRIDPDGFRIDP